MTAGSTRRAEPLVGSGRRWIRPAICTLVAAVATACGGGAMEPRGRDAQRTFELTIVLIVLGTAVFVFVLFLLGAALLRHRRAASPDDDVPGDPDPGDERSARRFVIGWGIAMPSVVLSILVGLTLWAGADMVRDHDDPLIIEVTGHQYWWDVRYPELGVRTANEIHLPAGRPVELTLRSADVIHSFWIPQLAGKRDLVPGRTNILRLESDEPGTYQGYCAEFCGMQHTQMRMVGMVHRAEEFDQWVQHHQRPARVHTDGPLLAGQEVFLGSACVYCHAVNGTNATSERGPDLTHLSSRLELGAGALPMTRGDLAGWILDPQHSKPGNQMPPTELSPDELRDLLDYLESLR